jgi:diguanylate cyclase (GGDEF)-like protein
MIDIDHFKQVNDQHGHARGDAVLRELAHRVQEQIREVDTFARYGGEEVVVVLPETTVEGANQLDVRICVAVRRELFHDALVQPDVHRGRIVLIAGIAELARQLLAVVEARIHAEQLHQIDDRCAPVQLLLVGGRHPL